MDHTKPAQWFRMYAEFATDPKVQMLSETDQRRYLMLLCLRCSNGDVTLHETEIVFQLRIGESDWECTKAALLAKNLIDEDCKPTAWDKRQFVSDSSAERVARHRANKKQPCNVTVTPPETETETETEKENTQSTVVDAVSAQPSPKKRKPKTDDAFDPRSAMIESAGLDADLVDDFLKLRKAKRAPTTRAALNGIVDEAQKAGWTFEQAIRYCCARNWQGFDADWVKDKTPPNVVSLNTKRETREVMMARLREDYGRQQEAWTVPVGGLK